MTRARLPLLTALAIGAIACASPPSQPAAAPVVSVAPPVAQKVVAAPAGEPQLTIDEARAKATAWKAVWLRRPRSSNAGAEAAVASFDAQHGIDEVAVRRVLEALLRDCLAERSPDAAACKPLGPTSRTDPLITLAMDMAGELGDTRPGPSETMRLLLRAEARGAWRAGMAIERVLERRMMGAQKTCAPPTPRELEAARASLGDVRIRMPSGAPRAPTEAELADLAYLQASLSEAGLEIGTAKEDEASPPLATGSPELARRAALQKAMQEALLEGDVARHASAAEAYLSALGYPGPIRVAEETDERWGGKGFSYALRLWGRSAEILGQYDVAEPLHRRAAPGGGMCGTSTPSMLVEQMQGAIRAAEQRDGCRPVAAERLYAPGGAWVDYGPNRLEAAGFDLKRLYRAGLLELVGAADAWSRIRAMEGYADVAGRDALPRLLDIAEQDSVPRRVSALRALAELLEDDGIDPCRDSNVGGARAVGVGMRYVDSIRTRCEGRLDEAAFAKSIQRVSALATHGDPSVREVVARVLGATGSPRARPALRRLARDAYDVGGTVCTREGDGPERCEPNRPVRQAAREGLEALARTDEMRRMQAEHLRESKKP